MPRVWRDARNASTVGFIGHFFLLLLIFDIFFIVIFRNEMPCNKFRSARFLIRLNACVLLLLFRENGVLCAMFSKSRDFRVFDYKFFDNWPLVCVFVLFRHI